MTKHESNNIMQYTYLFWWLSWNHLDISLSLSRFSQAFTLIELLIVIVIIGVLAVALIPRLTWSQARARDTARIADMRQLQSALVLYHGENGKYPGSSHYLSIVATWCSHWGINNPAWTTIFDASFLKDYLSSLPVDPRGMDPKYCYGYSHLPNTSTFCKKKDGTIIDIDGISATGAITWPQWEYVLTFEAETDLRDKYPRWVNLPTRFCVFSTSR